MAGGSDAAGPRPPREFPGLLVRSGRVYRPGPEGPDPVRNADGASVDAFDAFDLLTPNYRRIYVADLNGIEGGEPQLDLWQELAREADLWIDAGTRTADQAIDVLVSGARRAVLSTGRLRQPAEIAKAWALSQELAVEIEVQDGKVLAASPEWRSADPLEVAKAIRAAGPTVVILSPRGQEVDWSLVRRLAADGTLYVGGSYVEGQANQLAAVGARGGIFYPNFTALGGPSVP